MDDFSGFAPGSGDLFRLIGVGWIGALLIVGTTILAARWLIGWQMRRIERIVREKESAGAEHGAPKKG
jgi:hypothetical protein